MISLTHVLLRLGGWLGVGGGGLVAVDVHEVVATLKAQGVHAEADIRNEKINYKVREHSVGKVPVILAVGAREVEEKTVSVRRLGEKQTSVQALSDVANALGIEATPPDLRGCKL